MKRIIYPAYRFFINDRVQNPEFLIFFRIAVAALLFLHFTSIWADFDALYGKNALIPWDLHNYRGQSMLFLKDILEGFQALGLSYAGSVILYKCIFLLLCALIGLGFFSRPVALLLLVLQVAYTRSGLYFAYGVDYFCSMSLLYLVLLPSDDYFSLRNYLFRPKGFTPESLTPFRRLFQIHICFAYFISGLDKLLGFNWWNGESVWKAVNLPNFTNDFNISLSPLGNYPIVFVIAGWFTIIVEMCYPLFINIRQTRKFWLCLTIMMHVGILLVLNLYFFSGIMIIWNLANYYFPDAKKLIPHPQKTVTAYSVST